MEWTEWVTLALATIGSALGITNFIRSIVDERVRLRVIPSLYWKFGDAYLGASQHGDRVLELVQKYGHPNISVEVTNVSKFPVTVDEIGLSEFRNIDKNKRSPFFDAVNRSGIRCPVRIDPRESVNFYSSDDKAGSYNFTRKTAIYARTSCDHIQKGNNAILVAWGRLREGQAKASDCQNKT